MSKNFSKEMGQLIEPLKKKINDIEKAYRGLSRYVDEHDNAISLRDLLNEYAKVKKVIGNYHNHLSFIANLMAIEWLEEKEGFCYSRPIPTIESQNATGFDIDFCDEKGWVIGEIKTTDPTGNYSFGAQQKDSIIKDFQNLKKGYKLRANKNQKEDANQRETKKTAEYRYMFVTDEKSFAKLKDLFSKKHNAGKLGLKDEELLKNMICDEQEGEFTFKVVLLGSNEDPLLLNKLQ